jgi:hypothetical protein
VLLPAAASAEFFSVSYVRHKFVLLSTNNFMAVFRCKPHKGCLVKAGGLARNAKRIPETGQSVELYEGRMRVYDLGIIVVALIALTILMMCLFNAWMAFEKSLAHAF